MASNSVQFSCLYTRQKTQKRKVWKDGRLVLKRQSNQAILHDANPSAGSGDPVLGEVELTKSQTNNVMEMNETDLEIDQYLVTVEGPWINILNRDTIQNHPKNATTSFQRTRVLPANSLKKNVSQNNSGRPNMSVGMQKLLNRKFRKPSAYIPPPSNENKRQKILSNRSRPLQPGELEKRLYGNNDGENANKLTSSTNFRQHPNHQQHYHQQPCNQSNPPEQKIHRNHENLQQQSNINQFSTLQNKTPKYSSSLLQNAPQYQSQAFYGEEEDGDSDDDGDGDDNSSNSGSSSCSGRSIGGNASQNDSNYNKDMTENCFISSQTKNGINQQNQQRQQNSNQCYSIAANSNNFTMNVGSPTRLEGRNSGTLHQPTQQNERNHPPHSFDVNMNNIPNNSLNQPSDNSFNIKQYSILDRHQQERYQEQQQIQDNSMTKTKTTKDENENTRKSSTLSKMDLLAMFQANPNKPTHISDSTSSNTKDKQSNINEGNESSTNNPLMERFGAISKTNKNRMNNESLNEMTSQIHVENSTTKEGPKNNTDMYVFNSGVEFKLDIPDELSKDSSSDDSSSSGNSSSSEKEEMTNIT